MRGSGTRQNRRTIRRGAVAVQIAITMVVLLGCAALAIDVGAMYNAKGELQRAADASALAAAAVLGEYTAGDPVALARLRAQEYAAQNSVFGAPVQLDPACDIVFGRSRYKAQTNQYVFEPTEILPDSVHVTARLTKDSPNGCLSLYFAQVVGKKESSMSAEAIALMVPRDIAVVADLSGSHNDDSELQHYKLTDINLFEVWDDFPGGIDDAPEQWEGLGYEEDDAQAAGPAWGLMKYLGYGTDPITEHYDPDGDPGLIELPESRDWNNSQLSSYLAQFAGVGYSAGEIQAITSGANDDHGRWRNRVAVALGLARWQSGYPTGLSGRMGEGYAGGDGDSRIEDHELIWVETLGDRSAWDSQAFWEDYIDYMGSRNTSVYRANEDFRYQFGVKTFSNYMIEQRPNHDAVPEHADTRAQPMQAVKDSVGYMVQTIGDLRSNDQVSLEIYGTTARHEVDLTQECSLVAERLDAMQSAHYDEWTNMGGGMLRGIEELTGPRARSGSLRLMVVLTDGWANVNSTGRTGDYEGGRAYALEMAREAASKGIRLFAVSVGADCDTSLMDEIASIGQGEHFHAEGSIDEYSAQLEAIFRRIGGHRPVELIR